MPGRPPTTSCGDGSARNHGRIVREKVAQLYGFDLD
jgi:hypothetical protein